ncbi:hypothetical protein EC991_004074 [Linnemannia zychae]|nr:hypothetical protein EC991_004074 [Linnemannia zychae]
MKLKLLSLLLVATTILADTSNTFSTNPLSQDYHERRTLIGEQVSHRTQVDNSQDKQVFRVDQNGNSSARKGGLLYDLQRRRLLSDLAGSDGTTIESTNDNSRNSRPKGSQGSTHTITITRMHKEPSPEAEKWIRQHGLIIRRRDSVADSIEKMQLYRRELLWRGSSTTIGNDNDYSRHADTYRVHDNQLKKITKVVGTKEGKGQGDPTSSSIEKRSTTLAATTAMLQLDDGNRDINNDYSQKVDDIARRNLVTIQIVTQNTNTNTNGHIIDSSHNNNNVYPVKVIHSGSSGKKKSKKKSHLPSSSPRPHPASKNKEKNKPKRVEIKSRNNQFRKHQHNTERKETSHATKSIRSGSKNMKTSSHQQQHQSRPMQAKKERH